MQISHPTPPKVTAPGTLLARLTNRLSDFNVVLYKATGGRIGGRFSGAPVLLLHHVGRKSGQDRISPLLYLENGDDLVIVASRGGSDTAPAWWLNLRASPRTRVQVRSEHREVQARQVSPEEKAELWPRLVAMYPDYAVYQERTSRDIPVIALSRAT